mgnify:CR=1 FL=1
MGTVDEKREREGEREIKWMLAQSFALDSRWTLDFPRERAKDRNR